MEIDHLHQLVQTALDDFESAELPVTTRRAYRIARLRGDAEMAHRLSFELRPLGGSGEDRTRQLRAIYPGLTYEELRARHRKVLEEHIALRSMSRGAEEPNEEERNVAGGSLAELIHDYEQGQDTMRSAEADGAWSVLEHGLRLQAGRRQILERVRALVFDYLVQTEVQVELSDAVSAVLARHRAQVDQVLEAVDPEVRDKLQAAVRTARLEGGEARSQVLTTCRRVIVAVADRLFPASSDPHVSADGKQRPVGAGNYRNRILAAVEQRDETAGAAFAAAIGDLANRLDNLDDLLQKGVHAEVTQAEMEFGLAQTYLLAGELIRRTALDT